MSDQADADRRLFVVNDEQWESFNAALNRPAVYRPKLAELLRERADQIAKEDR